MESVSAVLFWVANSLLIPDIILLLLLFIRSIMLLGSFYNQYMIKKKNDKLLISKIKNLDIGSLSEFRGCLPQYNNSLFVKYLRGLLEIDLDDKTVNYVINNFENEAAKDLSTSQLLSKLGPVLGLIGTLIAMSPALVGLSTGDISGMAYNMQVVFSTTVVGLVISAIGLVTSQFKKVWYDKDVNNLDYVSQILIQQQAIENENIKKNA